MLASVSRYLHLDLLKKILENSTFGLNPPIFQVSKESYYIDYSNNK